MRPFLAAAALAAFLLCSAVPLSSGRDTLAARQFETAKRCFERQLYFAAQRWAHLASLNAPRAAGPWVLTGHCFYLRAQDAMAAYCYARARALDPDLEHLPLFTAKDHPAAAGPRPALSGAALRGLQRKIGQMIMV
ncbi:MAG TPA: hypothetical protein VFR02_04660, partial [bacterium]|nr:hypothetical protein [bacterium]